MTAKRDANWPKPVGWRILIEPIKPKSVSDGGVLLVDETKVTQRYQTCIGHVRAMGPLCYKSPKFESKNAWCKVGDVVCYLKHTGESLSFEDYEAQAKGAELEKAIVRLKTDEKSAEKQAAIARGTKGEEAANALVEKIRIERIEAEKEYGGLSADYELKLLNDDAILAVIPDPKQIKGYLGGAA